MNRKFDEIRTTVSDRPDRQTDIQNYRWIYIQTQTHIAILHSLPEAKQLTATIFVCNSLVLIQQGAKVTDCYIAIYPAAYYCASCEQLNTLMFAFASRDFGLSISTMGGAE